jgi:hypothetical protein
MMSNQSTVLDRYQQLVCEHSEQFSDPLQQLRQYLDRELQQLRRQEVALVQSQAVALQELHDQIATDAVFLLTSDGLQEFVTSLPQQDLHNYYSRTKIKWSKVVSTWLLHQSEVSLQVFDYETVVNPDDYDDERTHASYGYRVTVRWGEATIMVNDVLTQKIYGVAEQYSYSTFDQISRIYGDLLKLYDRDSGTPEDAVRIAEMSILVAYACQLLKLKVQTVQFTYDSNTGEGAE